MAESTEIFDQLERLESVLADTYALTGTIKDQLEVALSDNAQLMLENDRLRDRLTELEEAPGQESSKETTAKMLAIYNDGFHVCHPYYGKKLEAKENCLLCQEVLYR